MRIILLILAALFAVAPMLAAQTGPAADFTLPGLEGDTISLASYQGKIVILDFWAILCPPCRAEIPGFIEIATKYRERGVEIIGLSLDKEAGKLKGFVADNKINYPIALASKEVQNAYGRVQAIPTTFILDRSHRIVSKHVGFTEKAAFEAEIEELLKAEGSLSPAVAPEPEPASGPTAASAAGTPAPSAAPAPDRP